MTLRSYLPFALILGLALAFTFPSIQDTMGQASSMITQTWPPKSQFSVDDIPDLTGKVIIVTGANTGVGKETAKALLLHNAKVYIASRNQEKAQQAIEDLREQTGNEAFFLKLDLADLKSVKAAAEEFQRKETELHVLFNNGGVMMPPVEQATANGYDLQLGTNVLGHFYFTKLLLPVLTSTAQSPSNPDHKVRVVTTSSITHMLNPGTLDFNTFKDGPSRKKLSTKTLYAQSKFGNVVFAKELARRYGEQGIVSIALNPGNLHSDLQRHLSRLEFFFLNMILYPTPYGALTQLWGGTSAEGASFNGKYLIPWARVAEPRADTQDPELGKQFWNWMEEQVLDI